MTVKQNSKRKNSVTVSVLSAATVVTFTGAALVIPQSRIEAMETVQEDPAAIHQAAHTTDTKFEKESYQQFEHPLQKEGLRDKADRMGKWKYNPIVLEYLDLSRKEVFEAHQNGKSFQDIALEQGKDVEELSSIFEDELRAKVSEKYNAGRMSEKRYNKIIHNLPIISQKFVEGQY